MANKQTPESSPAADNAPSATDNFAFGYTDAHNLSTDDARLFQRARALIRIGYVGIAQENQAAMRAFFHPDYRFHGPGGVELNREQLWAYFASCRAAFKDFTVTRQTLMSAGGAYMASRTRFAGVFVHTFSGASDGEPIEPTGKPVAYEVVTIFRYTPNGQLLEEWVQYDRQAFLNQLRG